MSIKPIESFKKLYCKLHVTQKIKYFTHEQETTILYWHSNSALLL
jgi:hypothetical protein